MDGWDRYVLKMKGDSFDILMGTLSARQGINGKVAIGKNSNLNLLFMVMNEKIQRYVTTTFVQGV